MTNSTNLSYYNFPVGFYISRIQENSYASKSDLEIGYIITEIDGTKVEKTNDISNILYEKKGDSVTLKVKYTTGSVQNFIAANDGYYVLQVWGASGGGNGNNYGSAAGAAGRGGYSYGELTVTRGTKFFVYTGGTGLCAGPGLGKGGFNGGGSSMGSDSGEPGCGGGGALFFLLKKIAKLYFIY